jgi:hypothetical protein
MEIMTKESATKMPTENKIKDSREDVQFRCK